MARPLKQTTFVGALEQQAKAFLMEHWLDQLDSIRFSHSEVHDIYVDMPYLLQFDPGFVSLMHGKQNEIFKVFERVLSLEPEFAGKIIDVRFTNLPPRLYARKRYEEIKFDDQNSFAIVRGTITGCVPVQAIAVEKVYRCEKCEEEFTAQADISQYNAIDPPSMCSNCRGFKFIEVPEKAKWKDYKEIRLREFHIADGSVPATISVILMGNLSEQWQPGENVQISGQIVTRWKQFKPNQLIECSFAILASSSQQIVNSRIAEPDIEMPLTQNDFENRLILIENTASHLQGLYEVKLGLLLSLIGANKEESRNTRNLLHWLIIGEESTGKSELLRKSASLVDKSIMINAIGASKSGLSLGAAKEGKEWVVEAGALVLMDNGVCWIDDINQLTKDCFQEIYESMESQSISLAKAGMMCKVNTRTTLLATARPSSFKYNHLKPLANNIDLPEPLLNRFDLVFLCRDEDDELIDAQKVEYIGKRNIQDNERKMTTEQLKQHIQTSQDHQVEMSPYAKEILFKYYNYVRELPNCKRQMSTRQLESIIRLAEAHAKLLHRRRVERFDAISTILLLESSCFSNENEEMDLAQCFVNKEAWDIAEEDLLRRFDAIENTQDFVQAPEWQESHDVNSQSTVANEDIRHLPTQEVPTQIS